MLDLIEIELKRIRRMAEEADNKFLMYVIDMAILEASRAARINAMANPAYSAESDSSLAFTSTAAPRYTTIELRAAPNGS
jgi:hypothetical protein